MLHCVSVLVVFQQVRPFICSLYRLRAPICKHRRHRHVGRQCRQSAGPVSGRIRVLDPRVRSPKQTILALTKRTIGAFGPEVDQLEPGGTVVSELVRPVDMAAAAVFFARQCTAACPCLPVAWHPQVRGGWQAYLTGVTYR